MPLSRYAGARGRSSRYNAGNTAYNIRGSLNNSRKNYAGEQTGTKRHEFITNITGLASLPLGEFATLNLIRFARSFDNGQPDVEDDPTASNNYQTERTMNGSRITGYECKIKMQNIGSASPVVIDIYSIITLNVASNRYGS